MKLRAATLDDKDAALALFPRLADFDLPPERVAEHLWKDDAALFVRHLEGDAPECFARVAVDEEGVVGVALVTLREEALSHEPSAHLEAIAVAPGQEGKGIGGQLLDEVEREAQVRGASSMTLNVFARNVRARGLYERAGFDGELLRYIKRF